MSEEPPRGRGPGGLTHTVDQQLGLVCYPSAVAPDRTSGIIVSIETTGRMFTAVLWCSRLPNNMSV